MIEKYATENQRSKYSFLFTFQADSDEDDDSDSGEEAPLKKKKVAPKKEAPKKEASKKKASNDFSTWVIAITGTLSRKRYQLSHY